MKSLIFTIIALFIGFFFFQNQLNKTKNPSLPQEYIDDRANFAKASQNFNEAMDLTKPPDNSGKPFNMSKEQEAQIIFKLEEGINLSNKVDDNFLDYLNPDLKNNYRSYMVKGYELFLEGLKSETSNENSIGVKKQFESVQYLDKWNLWWDSNKKTITNKAYPD